MLRRLISTPEMVKTESRTHQENHNAKMVSKSEPSIDGEDPVSTLAHDLNCSNILRTEDILIHDDIEFKNLLLPDFILRGLDAANFHRPSPIQLRSIPLLRLGLDLIVQSKAGTGKTLIITLAALETVKIPSKRLQVIVVTPTREIALQTKHFINTISSDVKIKTEVFIGGTLVKEDRKNLLGCQIAIGTPGRLNSLIETGDMSLNHVRLFVLDEADKLMEKSIFSQVKAISKLLPTNKQTILCSATFLHPVKDYVMKHMKEPFWVTPEESTRLQPGNCEQQKSASTVLVGVTQYLKIVPNHPQIVRRLKYKLEEILDILSNYSFTQCIIFSNYQTRAETICHQLVANGWPAMSVRGQDDQSHRTATLNSFKDLKSRLLLTTDVMSRGVDFKGVDLVINLDIPYDPSTYLHRMGRAGRFGSHGCVVTLASEGEEVDNFQKILSDISDVTIYALPSDLSLLKQANRDNGVFFDSTTKCTDESNVIKGPCAEDSEIKVRDFESEGLCSRKPIYSNKEEKFCENKNRNLGKSKNHSSGTDVVEEQLGSSLCEAENIVGTMSSGEAVHQVTSASAALSNKNKDQNKILQKATAHVSEALMGSKRKDMKFHSYEELETMFSQWVVTDATTKCDNNTPESTPKCKDWWSSASVVLTSASLQLEEIKEKAVPKPEHISIGEHCESSASSESHSSAEIKWKTRHFRKKRSNKSNSKSYHSKGTIPNEDREVSAMNGSMSNADTAWVWDETSRLFYIWDDIHSCYHLYNPYLKCSFKWEPGPNKYFKWDSDAQIYRLWDCEESKYLKSHVQETQASKSEQSSSSEVRSSTQENVSNWFHLWNRHLQCMSLQVYQMEYLNSLLRKSHT